MLRHSSRERRSDVQDEVAAGDRLGPAGVALEIGGGEGEPVPGVCASSVDERPHVGLAGKAAHAGAHPMARGQAAQDAVAADEPRPHGHENQTHGKLLARSGAREMGSRKAGVNEAAGA
jgi:hypothetical protein